MRVKQFKLENQTTFHLSVFTKLVLENMQGPTIKHLFLKENLNWNKFLIFAYSCSFQTDFNFNQLHIDIS